MRSLLFAHFALVPALLSAQGFQDHAIVLSRTSGPAAAALFDADFATGSITPIGRFGLDGFPPLAVAVDAVNRDVVVALATMTAGTVLVRLTLSGTTVVQQTTLGDVPGVASSLAQGNNGRWITVTAAGIWETERNGGVARFVAALPLASALESFGLGSAQAVVAQSGSAVQDPQVRWIDLRTGQTTAGPWVYTGHQPRGITGVGGLPTGPSRQVVSQEDGTIAISVNLANPVPLPLQPVLPPGATLAMRMVGLDGVALGGSAHPFLKSFQALGGTRWTILAGPVPGDPVDFALRPNVLPATVTFGDPCFLMRIAEDQAGGPPRIGNPGYGLSLAGGASGAPAFLMVGSSDQRYLTLRLPAPMPGSGGCLLQCSAETVLPTYANPWGNALLTLGVPNDPALVGGIVFAQWLQAPGWIIDASNAAAVWITR